MEHVVTHGALDLSSGTVPSYDPCGTRRRCGTGAFSVATIVTQAPASPRVPRVQDGGLLYSFVS
jgi:hypothetical protein